MDQVDRKIVIGITGASGSIYAKVLLDKLTILASEAKNLRLSIALVMSDNARIVWATELGSKSYEQYSFQLYGKQDFNAPFASGSAQYDTLIICPCSMGTMGRIAGGISSDLLTRAADVVLKERRKLIIVPRDTPLNLIHLRNMVSLTEAGAIICPAMPSFYSRPSNMEELAATVVDRILDLAGLQIDTFRWAE
jgi:4-hydroxy-3-polyprenylbenzoate decarboxylase